MEEGGVIGGKPFDVLEGGGELDEDEDEELPRFWTTILARVSTVDERVLKPEESVPTVSFNVLKPEVRCSKV